MRVLLEWYKPYTHFFEGMNMATSKTAVKTASEPAAKASAGKKPAARKAPVAKAAVTAAKPAAKKSPAKAATPAAKPAAPAKAETKQAAKPTKPVKAPKAEKALKPVKPAKPSAEKAPRAKLVRDSFTMPDFDFALIDELKARAMGVQRQVKKSELLRAGLQALAALAPAQLLQALERLAPVKTGRPKKGH